MSTFTKTYEVEKTAFTPNTTVSEPPVSSSGGKKPANHTTVVSSGNFINTGNVPQKLVLDGVTVSGAATAVGAFTINGTGGLVELVLAPNDGCDIRGQVNFKTATTYDPVTHGANPIPTEPASVVFNAHWVVV